STSMPHGPQRTTHSPAQAAANIGTLSLWANARRAARRARRRAGAWFATRAQRAPRSRSIAGRRHRCRPARRTARQSVALGAALQGNAQNYRLGDRADRALARARADVA